MIIKYRFDEISVKGERNEVCECCKKKRKRIRKFAMTHNPFNKNPDGTVRTEEEILAVLNQRRAEWMNGVTVCASCSKIPSWSEYALDSWHQKSDRQANDIVLA